MRKFLIASLVLHGVLLIIMALGLSNPFGQNVLQNSQPLLIDFVQIAEHSAAPKLLPEKKLTNKEAKPVEPEPADNQSPPPEEEKKQTEPEKETKPQPQETKPKESAIKEPPPVEKQEIAEEAEPILKKIDKKPEPPKKPKEQPKKQPIKKPEVKAPEKKSPKKAEVNLNKPQIKPKVENKAKPKVDKTKKASKSSLDKLLGDISKENVEDGGEGASAQKIGDTVTASEVDVLRQHIRQCWVVPAGIKGAKDMVVDIKMEINREGEVLRAEIIDKKRLSSDSSFRTAAESAKRAVLDPQCQPLPLPKGKYDQWKDLEFSFNPKDMY